MKVIASSSKSNLTEPLTSTSNSDSVLEVKQTKKASSLSLIKKIFFTWTLPLISQSNSQKLTFKSIKSSPPFDPSITKEHIDSSFIKLKHNYRNKNLFYTIISTYSSQVLFVIAISLFLTLLKTYQIKLLGTLIVNFKNKDNYSSIYYYSSLFLFVKFIQIVINYHNHTLSQILGKRVSASLSALIYDKVLTTSMFVRNDINKGELINYIQSDVETLNFLFFYGPQSLVVPCQIGINMFMLFKIFGPTFIYSMVILGTLIVIAWIIQKMYIANQRDVLKYKDNRIKEVTFSLSVIKMIKLFTLENIFLRKINKKRRQELYSMKKLQNIYVLSGFVHWSIPLVLSIVSIGAHTLIFGSLPIENLIMAIEIFDSISYPLYRVPIFVTNLLNTIISMKRIEKFLNVCNIETQINCGDINDKFAVKINRMNFGIKDKKNRDKIILNDITLEINKEEIFAILGETGSGKTCLANAILGHFPSIPIDDASLKQINGKISYASQIPFIINDTIRNNIVFFNEFDSERYQTVLSVCQLRQDIESLPGKDFTEISSNNLSGGQKARINLARAVYNTADIYIFDDPLSSVDSIISKDIVDKVLIKFLKGKTRILIKNDINNLTFIDRVAYMDKGGVKWKGTTSEFMKSELYARLRKTKMNEPMKRSPSTKETAMKVNSVSNISVDVSGGNNIKKEKNKGKLIKEEEQSKGKVSIALFLSFFKIMGNNSYIHVIVIIVLSFLWQFFQILSNFWLTRWSSLNKNKNNEHIIDENLYYFLIYCQIAAFCLFAQFLKEYLISRCLLNVYRILHSKIIHSVITAPINLFHDVVPIGQIINRLSYDLDRCKFIIRQYTMILKAISILMGSIIICYNLNQYSLICVPILFFIGFSLTSYYINCGRDLNRIESISKSPILNCYNESINGIISIRAYDKTGEFLNKYKKTLFNHYLVVVYKFSVNAWYSLFLNLLAFIYLFVIVLFANLNMNVFSPGVIGLLLKYSISFTDQMLNVFEEMSNIEKAMVNYERCDSYTKIPKERYHTEGKDEKFVVNEPKIEFRNYSMRYRPNTDLIFSDLNLKINANEKIGVVGRSGSGKSSIINALFRIIEPLNGEILIGDTVINNVDLYDLRSEIEIVPQEPFLFEGTLRENLDIDTKFSDSEISKVLADIKLFDLLSANAKGLDMKIDENGSNFSMGEKQLICFARALLHKKKIVIFDEATANVDKKTEKIILDIIEKQFSSCTVILISHKISNVMKCDRVIVMDKGSVIEYDKPQTLYSDTTSMFRKLCDNDKQK